MTIELNSCLHNYLYAVALLLELVMLYCGLDLSLRSCAGEFADRQGYLSDMGVKKDYRPVFPG